MFLCLVVRDLCDINQWKSNRLVPALEGWLVVVG